MKNTIHGLICLCVVSFAVYADEGPVFHSDMVSIPEMPRPAYLKSYVDPVFKSTVTRVTGDPGTEIAGLSSVWSDVARHNYSKYSAWNCNQSMIFLGLHHGFPSMLFLDGATYRPLFGRNAVPGLEMRWHATEPDIMVYVSDHAVGHWNVKSEKEEILAEFPGYSKFNLGPWEGNLSLDGNRIAIHAMKGDARVAFVYDFKEKKKYSDIALVDEAIDWVSVSASGKYVVVNGTLHASSPAGKIGGSDRTRIYDLEGKVVGPFWSDSGRPSHYDLTLDADGEDVAVGVSNSKPDEGRVIKRRLRDGQVTVLTPSGYAGHTSARNVNRPGWVYATYQHHEAAWKPYWEEVVAIKIDGSMTVERIAHLHATRGDYLTQAQAVASPDGQYVLWAGAWGGISDRPVGAYVARRAGIDTK